MISENVCNIWGLGWGCSEVQVEHTVKVIGTDKLAGLKHIFSINKHLKIEVSG